ncbi:MAG: hypothetical protein H6732_16570 [Alphaproteobacteria bacterium]|nr:hypothetical protein [Alphaproteobacteria bacterium]
MPASLLLLSALVVQAHAWDDTRPVVAAGETTQGLDVPIPLGFAFDPIVRDPIWVGLEIRLGGTATVGVELEGDGTLTWGGELEQGTFVWAYDAATTRLSLDNLAEFSVVVTVRDGDANGATLLSQTLTGAQVDWEDDLGVEDGALLPGDDPSELVVTEAGAGFTGIQFALGNFINFKNGFTGEIQADATVHGVSIATAVDGVATAGTPFQPGEGVPGLDVKVGYTADVDLDLAWVFTADPTLEINLGLFTIPIPIALKGQELQAIQGTVRVEAVGEARHPFGRVGDITTALPPVDAGAVTQGVVTVPNPGEGPLSLEVVGLEGKDAAAFSAPTTPWTVEAGKRVGTSLGVTTTTPGTLEATLELATSDPWNPTVFVPLEMEVRGPDEPDEDLSPDALPTVDGCGCASGASPSGLAGLLGLVGLLVRRRRSAR